MDTWCHKEAAKNVRQKERPQFDTHGIQHYHLQSLTPFIPHISFNLTPNSSKPSSNNTSFRSLLQIPLN
ncbi:hypothetical protein L1987_45037 [Smallanthus sonchifolius]|uniref:Uncharacterized protein n=1 Tax=Smallanthus sonchifolius TaxID=185202 RepID=A0ACB9GS66_9ASTR|nr:hypothetical protein L1987_45037 [Smallanthus sonchifolius]